MFRAAASVFIAFAVAVLATTTSDVPIHQQEPLSTPCFITSSFVHAYVMNRYGSSRSDRNSVQSGLWSLKSQQRQRRRSSSSSCPLTVRHRSLTTLSLSSSNKDDDSSPSSTSSDSDTVASFNFGPNAPTRPGLLRRVFPTFPWYRLPNLLTYVRCWAIPILVVSFYGGPESYRHWLTGGIFAVASFTDWLDGYLARRWDIASPFGAFLDPVADKLMVSTSLILLTGRYGPIIAVPTLIILAREIAVSALREWMAQRGLRDVVKVGFQGKVKTASSMVALTILLFVPSHTELIAHVALSSLSTLSLQVGVAMLYLCTLVTVTSGSVYFSSAGSYLFPRDSNDKVVT